jgi:hypothetical protein
MSIWELNNIMIQEEEEKGEGREEGWKRGVARVR